MAEAAPEEEEFEDVEEVSPEEKLQIVRHLISRAPAGEANSLVKDLKNIVGNLLTDELVTEFLTARGEKRYEFATGTNAVMCEDGKVEDGKYVDTIERKLVEINVATMEKTSDADLEDNEQSPLLAAIQSKLRPYADTHYLSEQSASKACACHENDDTIKFIISSKNTNLASYWTGNWVSVFTLNKSLGAQTLEGTIDVNVHYFEAGNVQLNCKHTATFDVEVTEDNDAVAKAVLDGVTFVENEFQTALTMFYAQNSTHFKKVRRALTIQGTKFDWRLTTHKNIGQMQ